MMKRSRMRISSFVALWVALLGALLVIMGGCRADSATAEVQQQQNCTYAVLIETTCSRAAGTSDHISLRFGDSRATDVLVRRLRTKHVRRVDAAASDVADVPAEPFQPCSVDQFRLSGRCVESPVCYIYLKQAGRDRWRPGMAQVVVAEAPHLSSKSFYFRRYLPPHVWHGSDACDTHVTPFGVKHTRMVFGDKRHPKLP